MKILCCFLWHSMHYFIDDDNIDGMWYIVFRRLYLFELLLVCEMVVAL